MTLTITLAPDTEAYLRDKAARQGQDAETVAQATLAETLAWEAQEFEETVAGIQRGLDAAAEGRERPFEDYVADVKRRRQARDQGMNERAA